MGGSGARTHWEHVYETKGADEVSWFQPSPERSLAFLKRTGLGAGAHVVDVGGGASLFVDRLLDAGFKVTVLDLSDRALAVSQARLGDRADHAQWISADVTDWAPSETYDLWHDRAVFHFLTERSQRASYIAALKAGLRRGGWLVMATFAPDGPERCSGLPVRRWSADGLAAELGDDFQCVEAAEEAHSTPTGSSQPFTWTLFRRVR